MEAKLNILKDEFMVKAEAKGTLLFITVYVFEDSEAKFKMACKLDILEDKRGLSIFRSPSEIIKLMKNSNNLQVNVAEEELVLKWNLTAEDYFCKIHSKIPLIFQEINEMEVLACQNIFLKAELQKYKKGIPNNNHQKIVKKQAIQSTRQSLHQQSEQYQIDEQPQPRIPSIIQNPQAQKEGDKEGEGNEEKNQNEKRDQERNMEKNEKKNEEKDVENNEEKDVDKNEEKNGSKDDEEANNKSNNKVRKTKPIEKKKKNPEKAQKSMSMMQSSRSPSMHADKHKNQSQSHEIPKGNNKEMIAQALQDPKVGEMNRIELGNGNYYYGGLLNSKFEGYGILQTKECGRHEGFWKNGVATGEGLHYDVLGNKYQGNYVNDKRNGFGVQTYINGQRYEGNFKNDVKQGYGVYIYNDGDIYEGHWSNDVYNGKGKERYANGSTYEGTFKNDEKDQKGIFIDHQGNKYRQHWKMGKLISEEKIQ